MQRLETKVVGSSWTVDANTTDAHGSIDSLLIRSVASDMGVGDY